MGSPQSNPDPFTTSTQTRLADDTVFYSIHPDPTPTHPSPNLTTLHSQILTTVHPLTSTHLWQHQPFTLAPTPTHLHGHLRYGDNLDDEWFTVFLLYKISLSFPNVSVRVYDSDGEFLLIEAAFYLPKWVNPETAVNRVFIRRGEVCIIPNKVMNDGEGLEKAVSVLVESFEVCRASDEVQGLIKRRVLEFPEKVKKNVHCVRVWAPLSVAQVC